MNAGMKLGSLQISAAKADLRDQQFIVWPAKFDRVTKWLWDWGPSRGGSDDGFINTGGVGRLPLTQGLSIGNILSKILHYVTLTKFIIKCILLSNNPKYAMEYRYHIT